MEIIKRIFSKLKRKCDHSYLYMSDELCMLVTKDIKQANLENEKKLLKYVGSIVCWTKWCTKCGDRDYKPK